MRTTTHLSAKRCLGKLARVLPALVVLDAVGMTSVCVAADSSPAVKYIDGVVAVVDSARGDLPRLTKLAEHAAGKLLAGGELYASPVAGWWQGELCGRAGGPMRVGRNISRATKSDVAIFALPHPALATLDTASALHAVLECGADLYVLGPKSMSADYQTPGGTLLGGSQRLSCLGGPEIGAGLYPRRKLPPMAPYRPVADLVRGWTFVGEVVGACTRGGKMPTMYQSIVVPGSGKRNASFKAKSGPGAGQVPFFHPDRRVPPVSRGKLGGEYLDVISRHLRVLRRQAGVLARGGLWMAEAKRKGRRVVAMAQGHAPALIISRKNEAKMPIDMYPGDYVSGIVPHAKAGDTVVALCYMAIPADKVIETLGKGSRVIIACPHGLPAELKDRSNLLWLDTAWKVGDAAVTVPGYDVKILPPSAVMQMTTLYALIAEMVERDDALRSDG